MLLQLTNEDNIKLMSRYDDNHFDLAIVDPPYGIQSNSHKNNKSRSKLAISKDYNSALWGQSIPTAEYFKQLERVSKHQIIFGINYFTAVLNLKFGSGRIIWDKVNQKTNFSDAEIAYCSMFDSTRIFRYMWNGMLQGKSINEGHIMQGNKKLNEARIHPTQKPVKLYKWLLMNYAKEGDLILDTHLGSGSIAIACHDLNFNLVGCELDVDYYNDAMKRIENHRRQLKLF